MADANAYQKGSDALLKINTGTVGTPVWTTVAAMTTKSFSMSSESVDVTNQDSPNKWRELLTGAGIRKASISGSGVFKDEASHNAVNDSFIAGTVLLWQLIIPALGQFQGPFQIVALNYTAAHNREVGFSVTLESAGEPVFTKLT